jgi:hypothetical protein
MVFTEGFIWKRGAIKALAIFDIQIPERVAMETAARIAVKLWVSIARNDAQTPCYGR